VEANLSQQALRGRMFVISLFLARLIGYDMENVRLTEVDIPTIFVKQRDAKPKTNQPLDGEIE